MALYLATHSGFWHSRTSRSARRTVLIEERMSASAITEGNASLLMSSFFAAILRRVKNVYMPDPRHSRQTSPKASVNLRAIGMLRIADIGSTLLSCNDSMKNCCAVLWRRKCRGAGQTSYRRGSMKLQSLGAGDPSGQRGTCGAQGCLALAAVGASRLMRILELELVDHCVQVVGQRRQVFQRIDRLFSA